MSNQSQAIAPVDPGQIIENVIVKGDLSKLAPEERARYYTEVCRSIGLNPLTKPFDYLLLNGKLTLYAKKDATDQLRKRYDVSVNITSREQMGDIYIVCARATIGGRSDESIGAVSIANLKGDALANAIMKAETKSKRRVTLSICGLGMLDETEVESIPNAQPFSEPPAKPQPQPAKKIQPPPAQAEPTLAIAGVTLTPLTWDEVATIYDQVTGGKARTKPMDSFEWSKTRSDLFIHANDCVYRKPEQGSEPQAIDAEPVDIDDEAAAPALDGQVHAIVNLVTAFRDKGVADDKIKERLSEYAEVQLGTLDPDEIAAAFSVRTAAVAIEKMQSAMKARK